MNNDEIRIALWVRESKKGTKYFSGLTKIENKEYIVTIFKNNKKNSDKSPEYTGKLTLKGSNENQDVEEKSESLKFDEIELTEEDLPF